jgi:hypothetical protein
MNIREMLVLADRVNEFVDYMNMFYSLDHDGVYAEEMQFTQDEIVDGINEYLKNDQAKKDIMKYGADTVDRELTRDIILTMRGEV